MTDSDSGESVEGLEELLAEYEAADGNGVPKKKEPTSLGKHEKEHVSAQAIEVPMDKVLFGDKAGLIKRLAKAVGDASDAENSAGESDDEATAQIKADEEGSEAQIKQKQDVNVNKIKAEDQVANKVKKRKPVWTDADDEEITLGAVKRETKFNAPLNHLNMDNSYKDYLTKRYKRIVAQPKWADLDAKKKKTDDDSDDEELLRTVGFLDKPAEQALPKKQLQFKQLKDLNRASYVEGVISCVRYHPSSTAALVCGRSGIATIYSIDGHKNEPLHSMRFHKYPIFDAHITPCGTKAIFGSIHRHFYSYDLLSAKEIRYFLPDGVTKLRHFQISSCGRLMAVAGRFGELHLFDAHSMELINSFKQNDLIRGIVITSDSRRIISSSTSNMVSIFNIAARRQEHSFIDEGCISGCTLAMAPNQLLLATGSMEGVVNVYDVNKIYDSKMPLPEKRIMNLKTAISDVKFNHSSELLALSSTEVKGAVKLVHFPSGQVYANFPMHNSDLGAIKTVEFSPNSGFMALGNRQGHVPFFRLKHFKNY